jgi:hypothetical protein
MPSLTKSLEKRIQELKSAIETQKTELAAYERVLEIELANAGQSRQTEATNTVDIAQPKVPPTEGQFPSGGAAARETGIARASGIEAGPTFSGSKTDFVAAIVKARGTSGATPKEIDEIFSARRIARSKNLIYNALSFLVKQRKLEKKDGRYFFVSTDSSEKLVGPKKRQISAEGLQRIREANRKRWAKERAARDGRTRSAAKRSARS